MKKKVTCPILMGALAIGMTSFAATTTAIADIGGPLLINAKHRYIVVAKSAANFDNLRFDAIRIGAKIELEMRNAGLLAISSKVDLKAILEKSIYVKKVLPDLIRPLIKPEKEEVNSFPGRVRIDRGYSPILNQSITPDPAYLLHGLMWNINRINAPSAWKLSTGNSTVVVGVADTGLDYTHSELANKVTDVIDFTDSYCSDNFGASDADQAATYGGPATTDWNGHGTWIGGNIASALDGVGVNGIAPDVQLVALKIAQWCGSAWDSSILNSFYYAADHNIDVVSISFGGYMDRTDPDQDNTYNA